MNERLGYVRTGLERWIEKNYNGNMRKFVDDFNDAGFETELSLARLRRLLDDEEQANKRMQIDLARFVKSRSTRVFNSDGQLKCRNTIC